MTLNGTHHLCLSQSRRFFGSPVPSSSRIQPLTSSVAPWYLDSLSPLTPTPSGLFCSPPLWNGDLWFNDCTPPDCPSPLAGGRSRVACSVNGLMDFEKRHTTVRYGKGRAPLPKLSPSPGSRKLLTKLDLEDESSFDPGA